ncbi:MAG: hypothetical protein QM726_19910 [Chitinophagaceae bacterium]
MKPTTLLCLCCIIYCNATFAQDANYWSAPYGPGGFLTTGATLARNNDSGVLFYNPALLAYNTKNAASISGSIYNFQSTRIKNGAGTGLNLNSSAESVVPGIASNTIYLNLKNKPITVAYALINDPVINYQSSQRRDAKINVLDDSYSPGTEYFVGQYTASNSVSQTSGVLAFGKPVSSKLAIGLSFSISSRKQTSLLDYKSRALINNGNIYNPPIVNVSEYYLAHNTNIGFGIKAGIAYDLAEKHHLGLLISAPLLHLWGSSDILSDNVINNLQLVPGDTLYLLANTKQTKLKSKWKMPLSTALGYTYDYGGGQLYFAVEYFTKVNEYNVITPHNDYFIRPDTANNSYTSALLRMKDARKAVVNFALAFSFPIKEAVTGFLSARTDFSYASDKLFANTDGYKVNTANWNLYHIQFGGNFKKRKFNLRSGLLLSYGSTKKYDQGINFDNPNEGNLLIGDIGKTKATRFSAGIMVAYIHNL